MPENNRTLIHTINLNGGNKLTYEKDVNGVHAWYRNGKKFSREALSKYKYYDSKLGGYRTLGNVLYDIDTGKKVLNNPIYTPFLNKLINDEMEEKTKKRILEDQQMFRFGKKHITLHTKGNMNLATIPYNMLDSIAINSGRSNTNIKTNLGLVGKESTFGGHSIPLMNAYIKNHPEKNYDGFIDEKGNYDPVGSAIYPYSLTTNHAYFINPYTDYITAIYRKTPYSGKNNKDKNILLREQYAKDAYENNRILRNTKHYSDNFLADSFARYAANPYGYNPGQGNYVSMVNNIGDEVWNEPQIQKWWNEEGKEHYNKGRAGYKKGGYIIWKDKAQKVLGLDMDNDNTYDYKSYYKYNKKDADRMLTSPKGTHFPDKYKTVYHPTFSIESRYSGRVNKKHNPLGLVGGSWDGNDYIMSEDMYKGPIPMSARRDYIENAENYGATIRNPQGNLIQIDENIWGGVLPNIDVVGKRRLINGGK